MEDIDFKNLGNESKDNEYFKVMMVVLFFAILFIVYMIYTNYILISTGQMKKIEQRSRNSKKNRGKWDSSEIG